MVVLLVGMITFGWSDVGGLRRKTAKNQSRGRSSTETEGAKDTAAVCKRGLPGFSGFGRLEHAVRVRANWEQAAGRKPLRGGRNLICPDRGSGTNSTGRKAIPVPAARIFDGDLLTVRAQATGQVVGYLGDPYYP